MELLQLEKINYAYPGGENVLEDLNLTILRGELILLCGPTGCGKSTLLHYIKMRLRMKSGLVLQNPESQIVHDHVFAELAFGLSNLGFEEDMIRRRVAETAAYFGISRWLDRETKTLSGGEKQLVNLAAIMAMRPEVLLLDEPTAMLDPIMAKRLISAIKDINRELGTTIIISEHRLDQLFADATRIAVMKDKKIFCADTPQIVAQVMQKDPVLQFMLPAPIRVFANKQPIPLTVKAAKEYITNSYDIPPDETVPKDQSVKALDLKRIRFSYDKNQDPVLSDLNLTIYEGEIFGLLGENGSGKSTIAQIACGHKKPYSGSVHVFGNHIKSVSPDCAMLFQNPTSHFVQDKGIGQFSNRHPYDLSGGEQQLLALELVLRKHPKLLILDEPAKGLDAYEKEQFISRIRQLNKEGMTILMVTHDIDMAVSLCDRMGLLFAGRLATCHTPREFCKDNVFYSSTVSKMFHNVSDRILTVSDARKMLGVED